MSYNCFGIYHNKAEYLSISKESPGNCVVQTYPTEICVCPYDFDGDQCLLHIKSTCKFSKVLINL